MHSRIFEISKTPVDENERFSSSDIPDNFYHSVADYTDDAVCILRRPAAAGAVTNGSRAPLTAVVL